MRIRFLLMNAWAIGGTVRATLDNASLLADHHEVEVVSVFRHRQEPRFAFDPRVPVRALVHLGAAPERTSTTTEQEHEARARRRHRCDDLTSEPSELIHPADSKYSRFSLLSDARLEAFLRGLEDGAVVGTRPGLNLAIARWVGPDVITVGQEHVYLESHSRRLQAAIGDYYPRLDAVTALTHSDTMAYRSVLPEGALVHHMPNALPPIPSASVDLDRRVVVAGGRVSRVKGFDLLVRAWELVHVDHPQWELWIYGHGPTYADLERQVSRSPAAASIRLHGVTPDLAHELPNGSIFVLSSRFEGFGLVLLEAMGHGLAVASFDCPLGPRDIIDHDVDGLLVPSEDVEGLAGAVRRLIAEPGTRRRLSRAAREKVEQFSPRAMLDRWLDLFDHARPDRAGRRRWLFGRPSW